jgi:ABC-type transport system involved in multi-copper enzyme maturation permease subunit
MIKTIVKKEISANLLSYKFFVVILLASVLIFTSFFIMGRNFKGRLADYQLIRPNPGEPIAVLRPNPLSIFAAGLEDSMTRSFEISRIGIETRTGQTGGNPIFGFFATPDFVYIIKVVLSLVALLFGFDAISREREDGTLKQMLSNALPRSTLLMGKWLGNVLSLAVPILLVTLLGIVLMGLDPSIHVGQMGAGRLVLLIAVALVYMAFFLSLGMFISAITRRSASSLVILLLVWSLLVFILPNLGTLAARQLVDLPSVRSLSEKREQIWTREVLLGLGDRAHWPEHYARINSEYNQMEEDFRNRFEHLVRLSKAINRISPAASLVYAATEIAGTGIGEESRFKGEVLRYKDRVLEDKNQDLKEAPAFSYDYRSIGRVLADGGLIDIAWLVILTVIVYAAGYAAIVRTDVR